MENMKLTSEQLQMIEYAKQGKNVLVDACIGSGKTTSIQQLCNELKDKKILYLTYNKLLKIDAKSKILNDNVLVNNYHGYAYMVLSKNKVKSGISDMIQAYNQDSVIDKNKFDVLVIDEYQDIDLEISQMLQKIRDNNKDMQIIAVGDMCQKIYDKTSLNVPQFINEFLGNYENIEYTKCFRLNKEYANKLSGVWGKKINGTNKDCIIENMNKNQIVDFLSKQDVKDVLCLGALAGDMIDTLNELETKYPKIYNKHSVYAKISSHDAESTRPTNETAIFTTFDGSKGLERPICVVFDFVNSYWKMRASKPNIKYDILRNIFLVSASRGKNKIIFVKNEEPLLDDETLKMRFDENITFKDPFDVSEMFNFKYKEDIEEIYKNLTINELPTLNKDVIRVKEKDGLIDLSPCINIYQNATYFKNYSMESSFIYQQSLHSDRILSFKENEDVEKSILNLISFETLQERYKRQVKVPYIDREDYELLFDRMSEHFNRDEIVQQENEIYFKIGDSLGLIKGVADVVKDNIVYKLKFVEELKHENFIEIAMLSHLFETEYGVIINTKYNKKYKVRINNKKDFLDMVINCITKNVITKYKKPNKNEIKNFIDSKDKMKTAKLNEGWRFAKPTEKQLDFIGYLESKYKVKFKGKTRDDASNFINEYVNK